MVKQLAGAVIANLKEQPVLLSLVVVDVLFLALVVYILYQIGQAGTRRDQHIDLLIERCTIAARHDSR